MITTGSDPDGMASVNLLIYPCIHLFITGYLSLDDWHYCIMRTGTGLISRIGFGLDEVNKQLCFDMVIVEFGVIGIRGADRLLQLW